MKKSVWTVVCLAALLVGRTTLGATTNAMYTVNAESTFKVGSMHFDIPTTATAVFLSDGTCSLNVAGFAFTANYALSKNGKQILLIPDANGLAAIESNVVSMVQSYDSGFTVSVKHIKFSRLLIKNGTLSLVTDGVSGKLSSYVASKLKVKGFTLKTTWSGWTLIGGTGLGQ